MNPKFLVTKINVKNGIRIHDYYESWNTKKGYKKFRESEKHCYQKLLILLRINSTQTNGVTLDGKIYLRLVSADQRTKG